MAYDNSNVKPPIIDLLYPSEEQRRACLKRKAQIEQLPTEFEKDLMLAQLSEQLTRRYSVSCATIFRLQNTGLT